MTLGSAGGCYRTESLKILQTTHIATLSVFAFNTHFAFLDLLLAAELLFRSAALPLLVSEIC